MVTALVLLDDNSATWAIHRLLGVDQALQLLFCLFVVAKLASAFVGVVVILHAGLAFVNHFALDAADFVTQGASEVRDEFTDFSPASAVWSFAMERACDGRFGTFNGLHEMRSIDAFIDERSELTVLEIAFAASPIFSNVRTRNFQILRRFDVMGKTALAVLMETVLEHNTRSGRDVGQTNGTIEDGMILDVIVVLELQ